MTVSVWLISKCEFCFNWLCLDGGHIMMFLLDFHLWHYRKYIYVVILTNAFSILCNLTSLGSHIHCCIHSLLRQKIHMHCLYLWYQTNMSMFITGGLKWKSWPPIVTDVSATFNIKNRKKRCVWHLYKLLTR